jgi:hypothetical protein
MVLPTKLFDSSRRDQLGQFEKLVITRNFARYAFPLFALKEIA